MIHTSSILQFQLPEQLACPLPTEERALRRDAARLLVSSQDGGEIKHTTFADLPHFLKQEMCL